MDISLADAIRGRVSRQNIVNPITDEVIVRENELVTVDVARKIEEMGRTHMDAQRVLKELGNEVLDEFENEPCQISSEEAQKPEWFRQYRQHFAN